MVTSNEVRIAVLEREMRDVKDTLRDVDNKLDTIVQTLAQMSGGKKAIFGLFAIIGAIIGGITAVASLWPRGAH